MRTRAGGRLVAAMTGAAAVAVIVAGGLVAPPAAGAAPDVCNPDGTIEDPAPFQWAERDGHWFGVLEYGAATFDIGGETLTTRAYRQEGGCFSIPGPTIHMAPGETYVLRFRNLLDYEAPSAVHNDFKDPNVTNLHTHGLHISGEGAGDDVTRMFAGGEGGDYVYEIPIDHMGGTYWYHAHHHGSTYLQVSTGGFGLIVIDDSGDQLPANVAAMTEQQLLVAYLDTTAAGTGGDGLVSGTLPAGWTVNGNVDGTVTLPPGTWQHWRILLADADARMKTLSISGSNCEAELLARDGVWRSVAPKDLPTNEVSMTGASRADLAVRCNGPAQLRVDGRAVASIVVAGESDGGPHPYAADGASPWSAARPSYLRDLRGVADVHTESISMGARTVNGTKFDIDTPTFTLNADAVQEWTIRGATNHPFHLHVYHFQPTQTCGDFEAGEYYDTIAANCTVRFDLNAATSTPYAGMTIMHCHILGHEDQGAMTWMEVVGGAPSPHYPEGDYALHFTWTEPPTDPPDPPGDVVLAEPTVVVGTVNQGKGTKAGTATVTVLDTSGAPVGGALVTGDFSGTFTEPGLEMTTDTNGTASFTTSGTEKGGVSVTFCVTSITHPSFADWTTPVCGSG